MFSYIRGYFTEFVKNKNKNWNRVSLTVALICTSLLIRDVEHISICLLAIQCLLLSNAYADPLLIL